MLQAAGMTGSSSAGSPGQTGGRRLSPAPATKVCGWCWGCPWPGWAGGTAGGACSGVTRDSAGSGSPPGPGTPAPASTPASASASSNCTACRPSWATNAPGSQVSRPYSSGPGRDGVGRHPRTPCLPRPLQDLSRCGPLGRVLVQAVADEVGQALRDARQVGFLLGDAEHHGVGPAAGRAERQGARGGVREDGTEAEDVGRGGDPVAAHLLGRHEARVSRRARPRA